MALTTGTSGVQTMREILFRAKAINRDPYKSYRTNYKNGDWVYGLITKEYDERFKKLPAEMTSTDGVSEIEVDYKTIGQFTGQTDKHGTKIFEGDILQNTSNGKTAVVQWFSEYSAFMLWCKSENQVYWLYDNDFLNIEVIGNIYNNPELFGGAEDET